MYLYIEKYVYIDIPLYSATIPATSAGKTTTSTAAGPFSAPQSWRLQSCYGPGHVRGNERSQGVLGLQVVSKFLTKNIN